jgi:hypothetical protein
MAKSRPAVQVGFGYLGGCDKLSDVIQKMELRVNAYRRYLHMNDREFNEDIRQTKTAIGVPVSSLINAMRKIGILEDDVNVFIYVDQYEDLANLKCVESPAIDYRAVINRALARRDPSVSYRIGSRGHAWHNHGLIVGTSARLEEERDYKFIDLDQKAPTPRESENVDLSRLRGRRVCQAPSLRGACRPGLGGGPADQAGFRYRHVR